MKTYSIKGKFTTVHDIAEELRQNRQQIMCWIRRYQLPHRAITANEKVCVVLVPMESVPTLRELNRGLEPDVGIRRPA